MLFEVVVFDVFHLLDAILHHIGEFELENRLLIIQGKRKAPAGFGFEQSVLLLDAFGTVGLTGARNCFMHAFFP